MRRYVVEDVVSSTHDHAKAEEEVMMSFRLLVQGQQASNASIRLAEDSTVASTNDTSSSSTMAAEHEQPNQAASPIMNLNHVALDDGDQLEQEYETVEVHNVGLYGDGHNEDISAPIAITTVQAEQQKEEQELQKDRQQELQDEEELLEQQKLQEEVDQEQQLLIQEREQQVSNEETQRRQDFKRQDKQRLQHEKRTRERKLQKQQNANHHAVVQDLLKGLDVESMTDVVLVGNDGIPVRASRFVLACRSQVFRQQLYANENDNDTVGSPNSSHYHGGMVLPCRGYNSSVLRAVVHYCFTNEISFLTGKRTNQSSPQHAREVACLAKFASKYQLDGLHKCASEKARTIMNETPALACIIYNETATHCPEIESMAFEIIQELPIPTLLTLPSDHHDKTKKTIKEKDENLIGVQYLGSQQLEKVLSNPKMRVEEIRKFKMLEKWYEKSRDPKKQAVARKCSSYIVLKNIEPGCLLTEVKDAGFIDSKLILEAITQQAMDDQADRQSQGIERSNSSLKNGVSRSVGANGDHLNKTKRINNANQIKTSSPNAPVAMAFDLQDTNFAERVIVEGAGESQVNGMYYKEDVGNDGEVLFVKRIGNQYGLFTQEDKWYIAPSADSSDALYECFKRKGKKSSKVPSTGWQTTIGRDAYHPAPRCKMISSKSSSRISTSSKSSSSGVNPVDALSLLRKERSSSVGRLRHLPVVLEN